MQISKTFTVDSIGACQGADFANGKIYLYGDALTGIIKEYKTNGDGLSYTGVEMRLSRGGKDLINHPTGLCRDPEYGTFIGNSTVTDKKNNLWKAEIFHINWDTLYRYHNLDRAVINIIEDDACIQGTRPEYVDYKGEKYLATADYGNKNNEVRLYRPGLLKTVRKTSEPGVLAYKFSCGPWVQNLHWIPQKKILVLIQNQTEGKKWKFTFVDLPKSIAEGKEHILKQIDFDVPDELEGFTLLKTLGVGLAVTSSHSRNVAKMKLDW